MLAMCYIHTIITIIIVVVAVVVIIDFTQDIKPKASLY